MDEESKSCNKNETGETCDCGHTHNHHEACGCGHEHGHSVTITFENGEDTECAVLGIFEANEREYIALLPIEDDNALIYRYDEVNGEPQLSQIESDEEYNVVAQTFNDLYEEDDE